MHNGKALHRFCGKTLRMRGKGCVHGRGRGLVEGRMREGSKCTLRRQAAKMEQRGIAMLAYSLEGRRDVLFIFMI